MDFKTFLPHTTKKDAADQREVEHKTNEGRNSQDHGCGFVIRGLQSSLQSKKFKAIFCGIGIVIIMLLVFKAGEMIGFRKANFSYRWGENYYRTFVGPHRGFPGEFAGGDFLMSHGAFGIVITNSSSTLIVKGPDEVEKNILITKDTIIKRFKETIPASGIKTGEHVVIVGSPDNNGQVEAKLIRILPRTTENIGR